MLNLAKARIINQKTMQFKENKAIYLQIADMICDDIAADRLEAGDKIPSVRECAADLEVNANTCARAYDWLQGQDVIFTKRGLGYFVCGNAKETVLAMKRKAFFTETLPEMAAQMKTLGVSMDEVAEALKDSLN